MTRDELIRKLEIRSLRLPKLPRETESDWGIIRGMTDGKKKSEFLSLGLVLKGFDPLKDRYVSREFQLYGYDLAVELGDIAHKALYIKLAKEVPREILEKARYFVKDSKARSKGKLFMWKLRELRKGITENF